MRDEEKKRKKKKRQRVHMYTHCNTRRLLLLQKKLSSLLENTRGRKFCYANKRLTWRNRVRFFHFSIYKRAGKGWSVAFKSEHYYIVDFRRRSSAFAYFYMFTIQYTYAVLYTCARPPFLLTLGFSIKTCKHEKMFTVIGETGTAEKKRGRKRGKKGGNDRGKWHSRTVKLILEMFKI